VGLFMRHGATVPRAAGKPRGCCSVEDAEDARRVAARLDMPFYALDFEREFDGIVDDFVASYRAGRTPNPCILCNRDLKFGKLLAYADAVEADAVATGHYARIVTRDDGRPALARSRDDDKDQTYVLFPLTSEILERVLLPVGDLRKAEVREYAWALDLPVAEKAESQEICFVPGGDYREVLRERDPDGGRPGEFVDRDGRVLGRHSGIRNFTVGQRHGLGLALGRPVYVVRLEPETGRVVVGDDEDLRAPALEASGAVWSGREAPAVDESFRAEVRIRYRHRPAPAAVTGGAHGRFRVAFDDPQRAITPGQAAVVYDGDRVLGGGWIDRARDG